MDEVYQMPAMSSSTYVLHKFLALIMVVLSWILIHRWSQRNHKGPKTWPIIGAAIEQLRNYDRMHDWLAEYLSVSKTITVSMPFTSFTYIADPANVEHVLKTNFNNYPKVKVLVIWDLAPKSCLILLLIYSKS